MKQLNKFITFKNIFTAALIIAILILYTVRKNEKTIKIVNIPEYVFSSDTIVVTKIVEKEIKVKDGTIVVGKKIFEDYEKEKDTVKKKDIFIEAVKIRDYSKTLVDNDSIKAVVNSKVQGELISQSIELTVKERKIKAEVDKMPRLSLILGTDLIHSNNQLTPMVNAGIQTRNGNAYKIGVGLDKSVSIGFSKTFTLIK